MKASKSKRPAAAKRQPRRKLRFPSYSVTEFTRGISRASRDAAAHGFVVVRKRGKVIGFFVKPSLHRIIASGKLPARLKRLDSGKELISRMIAAVRHSASLAMPGHRD